MMRVLLVLMCSSACAMVGGGKPTYDYFVLVARSAPMPAHAAESAGATVGVSHVSIPPYLDRESIVTRVDDYRVVYSTKERWAEPLDEAFARTLRQDLATSLARDKITVPTRSAAPTHDLQVDLLRFERRGRDRVELWARWTLRTNGESARTNEARIVVAMASPASAAAAKALSEAVARLATSIAADVRLADAELGRRTPTTAKR
jgi:uncharacterized lipoprotein YmbA